MMNISTTTLLSRNRSRGKVLVIFYLSLFLLLPQPAARAHEGPPFPIIVDRPVGPYLVSLWTDPDIGIGTFFVVLEPNPDVQNLSMEINAINIGVQPASGRLEEEVYPTEPHRTRNGARYWTEVVFDKGEIWEIRLDIQGEGWSDELNARVEATPDGSVGPIAIAIYAFPFVLVGILWVKAIMVRRQGTEDEEKEKEN